MQLRNPAGLYAAPVQELFRTAFPPEWENRFPDCESVIEWSRNVLLDGLDFGILLARRGDEFVGMAILSPADPPWSPDPWVVHMHAPKDRDVRDALGAAIVAWMRERAYKQIRSVNVSGLPDEVHCRIFGKHGMGTTLASVNVFTPNEQEGSV